MRTVLGMLAGLVSGQAAAAPSIIPVGGYHEHFGADIKVGGTELVGLRRGEVTGPLVIGRLAVDLPRRSTGMMCLDVTTSDGRYTGQQDFRIQSANAGLTPLDLRSQENPDRLRGYNMQDVAVRAVLTNDCNLGGPGTFVAARFSATSTPDTLTAMVNIKLSRAEAQLFDRSDIPVSSTAFCQSLPSGAATEYDHICILSLTPSAAARATTLKLRIIGVTGSRRVESFSVSLLP